MGLTPEAVAQLQLNLRLAQDRQVAQPPLQMLSALAVRPRNPSLRTPDVQTGLGTKHRCGTGGIPTEPLALVVTPTATIQPTNQTQLTTIHALNTNRECVS